MFPMHRSIVKYGPGENQVISITLSVAGDDPASCDVELFLAHDPGAFADGMHAMQAPSGYLVPINVNVIDSAREGALPPRHQVVYGLFEYASVLTRIMAGSELKPVLVRFNRAMMKRAGDIIAEPAPYEAADRYADHLFVV